jgi:hypothetical protein
LDLVVREELLAVQELTDKIHLFLADLLPYLPMAAAAVLLYIMRLQRMVVLVVALDQMLVQYQED